MGSWGASPQPWKCGFTPGFLPEVQERTGGGQGQLLAGPSGVWHGLDLCLSLLWVCVC